MTETALNLKEEKERLLEERAKNPEPMTVETTETDRLKIENVSLKKTMLNQQMLELDKQAELIFLDIKKRNNVSADWLVSINPQDLSKIVLKPKG